MITMNPIFRRKRQSDEPEFRESSRKVSQPEIKGISSFFFSNLHCRAMTGNSAFLQDPKNHHFFSFFSLEFSNTCKKLLLISISTKIALPILNLTLISYVCILYCELNYLFMVGSMKLKLNHVKNV
jgi:hypothetical protein